MNPLDRSKPITTAASAAAYDPYDADRPLLLKCSCGADHAPPPRRHCVRLRKRRE